jgi:hypothetical protein
MNKSIFDVYLVNGNITIFCGAHADEFKSTILNLNLYAELAAALNINDQEASWPTYTKILSAFKFAINRRESQRIEFQEESLLDIVLRYSGNALTRNERQILLDVFSRIKQLDSDSLEIKTITDKFRANVSAATGGTHALLTIVREDKTLLTLNISFETTCLIGIDILDKPVLKAIDDKKNNIRMLGGWLDECKHSEDRDTVNKKLGGRIETGLLHILTPGKLN